MTKIVNRIVKAKKIKEKARGVTLTESFFLLRVVINRIISNKIVPRNENKKFKLAGS